QQAHQREMTQVRSGAHRHRIEIGKRLQLGATAQTRARPIEYQDDAPGVRELEPADQRWRDRRLTMSRVDHETALVEQTDPDPRAAAAAEYAGEFVRCSLPAMQRRECGADGKRELCPGTESGMLGDELLDGQLELRGQ